MLHAAKAFEIASENDFARNILLRATQEEPNLTPHLEFKNVLVTSSPAGFIQPLNNTKQIVWPKAFIQNQQPVDTETTLLTLRALFALKHGHEAKTSCIFSVETKDEFGFHAPDPETFHVTTEAQDQRQGLLSLPEESDIQKIYYLSDAEIEKLRILALDVGDATSFGEHLIHSAPITDIPGQTRTYATSCREFF